MLLCITGMTICVDHYILWQDFLDIGMELCVIASKQLLAMDRASGATAEHIASKQDQVRARASFMNEWLTETAEQGDFLAGMRATQEIENEKAALRDSGQAETGEAETAAEAT